jgi:hypothetical protein
MKMWTAGGDLDHTWWAADMMERAVTRSLNEDTRMSLLDRVTVFSIFHNRKKGGIL